MPIAAIDAEPNPPEHELKLALPAARAGALLGWLRARCLPDPKYPDGRVTSVYFDNRGLALLREKVNSDFIKQKVRLRWYEDPVTRSPRGPAFVELKRKVGGRRFKTRMELDIDANEVAAACEDPRYLRRMLEPLRRAGHRLPSDLLPFMHISFRRRRFVDPIGRSRISLDTYIRGRSVGVGLLPPAPPEPLAHAVLEVKGPHDSLPRWLAPLGRMGCRRESFSKYARCYLKLTRRSSF